MNNFGKYLLLILTFLSISEALAFNFTTPEVKEDLPFASENLKSGSLSLFAFRENPFQEISDISNKTFFPIPSVVPVELVSVATPSEAVHLFYIRDLRKNIYQQLFPKHFFL
ncbi:hypothetical protein HC174_02160 [Salinimicrobium sp. CDJ15-81-2]|nr:hypothetical protein [Salinimicrobium nanhaiense]